MITQMKKYTFLVFHRDYEAFLEQLRAIGVVHITEKAAGAAEDTDLQQAIAHAEQLRKTIANGRTPSSCVRPSPMVHPTNSCRRKLL